MQYKIEGLDCGTVVVNDPDNKISGGGSVKLGYMQSVDENRHTGARFIFDLPEKGTLTSGMLPKLFTYSSYGIINIKLENATSVGNNACKDMEALCEVYLPNAVSIGESAFENCVNLGVIDCPECLSIGANAFKYTSRYEYHLANINFLKLQSIGANAFEDCCFEYQNEPRYTIIQFPEVRTIGAEAFKNSYDLGDVSFPKVESIGNDAFAGMSLSDGMDRKITISLPSSRREQFEPNLSTYGIDTEKHIVNWV